MQELPARRRWFDAPDSEVKREDGQGSYLNVEGRFQDHPVLNLAKSKARRHNVYDIGVKLEMRVKMAPGDVPAERNRSAIVLRFDKDGIREPDFQRMVECILRFPEAWRCYQEFRQSAVLPMERQVLRRVGESPLSASGKIMVDDGSGQVVAKSFELDEDEDDEERDELAAEEALRAARASQGGQDGAEDGDEDDGDEGGEDGEEADEAGQDGDGPPEHPEASKRKNKGGRPRKKAA